MAIDNSSYSGDRGRVGYLQRLESAPKSWRNGLFRFGFSIILFELISGTYLWVTEQWDSPGMMFLLGHLIVGLAMIVPCVMFPLRHVIYRKIWEDRFFLVLGQVTAGGLCVSFITGVGLIFWGVTGIGWVWWIHLLVSYGSSAGAISYIYVVVTRTVRQLPEGGRRAVRRFVARTVVSVVFLSAVSVGVFWMTGKLYRENSLGVEIKETKAPFLDSRALFPSQVESSTGGYVRADALTGSKSCGTSGCHAGIFQQFEQSAHYRTPNVFVDKVGQALLESGRKGDLFDISPHPRVNELKKGNLGSDVYRVCAGCHAPVALLSGAIGREKPLPSYPQHEGVSCVLCHSIDKNSVTNDLFYGVALPSRTLFWEFEGRIPSFVHRTLIKVKPEFHAKAFSKPSHKTSEYCAACHLKHQYESWHDSPYRLGLGGVKQQNCQDCHMSPVPSVNEVSGVESGTVADHRFLSAGFSIAKYYGLGAQFQATEQFIRDKKLSLQILAPEYVEAGKQFGFVVRAANLGVGHSFPAGPEGDLTEAWISITITDSKNRVIFEYGALDKNGYLNEKTTEIYRMEPFDSLGRPLGFDKHLSHRYAKEALYVLPPREFDQLSFTAPAAPGITSLTIHARLLYRKPNQRFSDWALGKGKFVSPVIELASDKVIVLSSRKGRAVLSAASRWRNQIATPMEGLKARDRRSPVRMEVRLSVEERIVLWHVSSMIRKGELRAAKDVLNSLPKTTQVSALMKRVRQQLEAAGAGKGFPND